MRGVRVTSGALYDRLLRHPKYDRFVIQQRLMNHLEVLRLTGSPFLQTARLTTHLEVDGSAAFVGVEAPA